MKRKLSISVSKYFLLFALMAMISSCTESDEERYQRIENQVNDVTFKIYSNTPGALIHIPGLSLTIKDYWETTYHSKENSIGFSIRCDDPTVLITAEVYVNGRLKSRRQENKYLYIGVDHLKYP